MSASVKAEQRGIARSNYALAPRTIPKITLPPNLASYLREELNILNVGYLVKERSGLPTYGEKRFIKTLEQTDDAVLVPRGFLKNLYTWLDNHLIKYRIIDKRFLNPSLNRNTACIPDKGSSS